MPDEENKAPEIVLLKSEVEAAAARVAERAMNQALDGTSSILGDLIGGWFGDGLKQWRVRRLIDTLVKTKLHFDKHNIPMDKAKSVPMVELLTIFENASKEDDDDLSEMWAGLLASKMDPLNNGSTDRSFLSILSNMSGGEARLLKFVGDGSVAYKEAMRLKPQHPHWIQDRELYKTRTDEHKSTLEAWSQELRTKLKALYDGSTHTEDRKIEESAIVALQRKGLIIDAKTRVEAPYFLRGVQVKEGHVTKTIEELNEEVVSASLQGLIERINDIEADNYRESRPLLSMNAQEISLNYFLTGLGEDLLSLCKGLDGVR